MPVHCVELIWPFKDQNPIILVLSLICVLFVDEAGSVKNIYHAISGDKLTDEECDQLFQGQEDSQGNINYEGLFLPCVVHLGVV